MKFLVVIAGLCVATSSAVPLTAGYGTPAAPVVVPAPVVPVAPVAPIQQVNIPVGPEVLEPPVAFRTALPFAPATPLRFLNPGPFAPRAAPLPFAPRAAPLPLAPRALPFAPTPLAPRAAPLNLLSGRVAAPVVARGPANLVAAAPVAAPVVARGPANLVAAPVVPTPLRAAPVPLPLAAPVAAPSSQFHAQDELGGFSFGYQNLNSAKNEVRLPNGVTRGSYSYVDANGIPQTVEYVADPVLGFRVAATNLPVAPAAPVAAAVPALEGPVAVAETAEVLEARALFRQAFEEAVARNAEVAEAEIVVLEEPADRKKREAIEAGYGTPAAPIVTTTVVEQPAVVAVPAPAPVVQVARAIRPIAPVVPGPLRVASPLPIPAPFAPRLAPVAPLTPRVPLNLLAGRAAPLPLSPAPVAAPVLARGPANLVAARVAAPVAVPTPLRASPLPLAAAVPAPLQAVIPAPVAAPAAQFHAQDELGGFSFGYQNADSARRETRLPNGVTTGSYSYVDANGLPQTVNYVADALGFRVQGTNLPVAPVA